MATIMSSQPIDSTTLEKIIIRHELLTRLAWEVPRDIGGFYNCIHKSEPGNYHCSHTIPKGNTDKAKHNLFGANILTNDDDGFLKDFQRTIWLLLCHKHEAREDALFLSFLKMAEEAVREKTLPVLQMSLYMEEEQVDGQETTSAAEQGNTTLKAARPRPYRSVPDPRGCRPS